LILGGGGCAGDGRVTKDNFDIAEAILERRLEEARALGLASDGLASKAPHLSARSGLSDSQRCGGWSLLGALLVFAVMVPDALAATAMLAASGLFGLLIVFRIASALSAWLRRPKPTAARKADEDLPVITYLVPLYDEPNVVAALVEAIAAIDYPVDRRNVLLLVEADDADTIGALRKLRLPEGFEIVPAPPGEPRTKPRALNYGLAFARGDIVAVLDAEDRPSPHQAREAADAFFAGGRDLAVVQAPLLAHNGDESWISRQFELEYAIHFLVWLPFLARLGAPLALGGTSNYFRRDKLQASGGWDAWNVTEDADLGLRLARLGGRAATITAPTFEEAPIRFEHWLSQRTRWMKGHVQTWLVLMRNPLTATTEMGWISFLTVQLSLGGSLLTSILHAPIMALILATALTGAPVHVWAAALLGTGYGSVILASMATGLRPPPLFALATLPLYWPLLSVAMLRALWEMKTRPHFWAKTPHGVSAGPQAPPSTLLHAAAEARASAAVPRQHNETANRKTNRH
jgi:cellulose synthase/poly-beta-1,6-N-acetylglucosamine synthase-like glycosyltransferase